MSVLISQDRGRIKKKVVGYKPLRVAFVIDELATAGTETQLLALLNTLDRQFVQPSLVLLRGDNPRSKEMEPNYCPILRLEVKSLLRFSTLKKAWKFRCWLREKEIDVVQAYFPDSSYFSLPLAWLAGVRNRIRVRNNLGHWITPFHQGMGQIMRCFTTQFITNSKQGRDQLLAEGILDRYIEILPNGVNLNRFLDLKPKSATLPAIRKVGIVANLRYVKGIDILIQAAAVIKKSCPDVLFEVAGEGDLRPGLENQIASLGLKHQFRLHGLVDDIPRFLDTLDVAVLCSRSEGMSNALLEYMAAARPIVATKVGAAEEMLVDGKDASLVPPGDPESLAEAIQNMLLNPEKSRRMGLSARQKVIANYQREAMVARFQQFYQCFQGKS